MTWLVYHGSQRKFDVLAMAEYNVLLTTYETIVADKKLICQSVTPQLSLFDITWHRIILDEGELQ
jgi:SNF2 family DNA or RNA helicase